LWPQAIDGLKAPVIPWEVTLLFFSTLFLGMGCIEDIGKDKARAIVEEAPTEAPVKATAPGQTLAIDPAASKVGALGAKVTKAFPLVFHTFEGTLTVDGNVLTAATVTVDVASLVSPHDRLTSHLMAEDFLWTGMFPKATFVSSNIAATPDAEGHTHTVTGTLDIRGKSKKVTFPATVSTSDAEVKASAEFAIDRQDFEVLYVGKADDLVQDSVVLTIALVASRS
jgi:polyisoprenoid-binding protein YceI